MHKIMKSILWLTILVLLGCTPNSSQSNGEINQTLIVKFDSRIIEVEHYDIKFGSISKAKVEKGLSMALDGLKESYQSEIEKNPDLRVQGDLTYTFRLEPNGLVRMLLETEINFKEEAQTSLRDVFTSHLMKKQIKFPESEEMAMIEATFKFE